jgi:16S rRNA pseudouridine516 synthase
MLNKPKGCISATKDDTQTTVTELVDTDGIRGELFPVGRLDIDTTGLLILTNDGDFAHRTLSPRRHVDKKYIATVSGELTEAAIAEFAKGIRLSDAVCEPAELKILSASADSATAEVIIHEGKFHQVKRMFAAVGCRVTELKRVSFGAIELDEALAEGESRPLNKKELEFVATVKANKTT